MERRILPSPHGEEEGTVKLRLERTPNVEMEPRLHLVLERFPHVLESVIGVFGVSRLADRSSHILE
jgi:hypothetical protein